MMLKNDDLKIKKTDKVSHIEINFTTKAFDKITTDCAVVALFEGENVPKGHAALIDWRLNGKLSQLILDHNFISQSHDALLVPSEGRVKSDSIMVIGLGQEEKFDNQIFSDWLDITLKKLSDKKVESFVICLSDLIPDRFEWRNNLRLLVSKMRNYEVITKVFFCENVGLVREAKRRGMEFGPKTEVNYDIVG